MKRILLSALLAASLPALAQTEKGRLMVGVGLADISAGIQPGGGDGVDYFSVNINPSAGYFVAKNLAVGTSIGLGWGKSGGSSIINYGVHPFARYYFGEKKTRLFAQAGAGIYAYRMSHTVPPNDNGSMFTFAAGPGVTHFLNQNVAIESSLMFRGTKQNDMPDMSYTPSLNFGFQIYLNGFKKAKPAQASTAE
ncbi:acyloxyacyl hydrolase [Polluticoccus soli]|uniref:acyloxyacyl hydrolase n=1 Tax=Polluticoccus soli TaxID=3034150 RepID=UPI0023E11EEF|nr:acyloxyacyl hydrolase [Flavipsychrobacter sp. JY13-12]